MGNVMDCRPTCESAFDLCTCCRSIPFPRGMSAYVSMDVRSLQKNRGGSFRKLCSGVMKRGAARWAEAQK